jgi:aspartate-semialdehyde dehydrogenase
MRVAVVGATGLVGQEMLRVLEEFRFPVTELIPVASEASEGKQVALNNREFSVTTLAKAVALKPDLALFSAGGSVSREWAPRFVEAGTLVVDNSSAWRMEPEVPLVVPEVNAAAAKGARLIANPNCSTIQLVAVLAPLRDRFGLRRVVVSTYQAVTGTGKAAVDQLFQERRGEEVKRVYPHPIDLNALPHIDVFQPNGYTKEEMKVVNESRKILALPELAITCTAVRIPVLGGHSESVNVELERDFDLEDVRNLLSTTPGLVLMDDPSQNYYPMPIHSHGRNEVFVGRIRRDESQPHTLNLWIVADNLRKGAATNAVQIAADLLGVTLYTGHGF